MKSIVIIAILSLIAVKLSFSNESVYNQYLWRQYLGLWDPDLGSNIDMRRVLNKATTNPSLGSKEAKEIIKQGKKIVPFIISVGEVSCILTKMKAIAIIKKIYGWEDDHEIYDSNVDQYWENMKKRILKNNSSKIIEKE